MSDDKFEDFLQREAKAYNTPPTATPRDEMWQAIAASRAERRGAAPAAVPTAAPGATPGATPGANTNVRLTPLAPRKPRLRYTPWIGMAATLLIGVGIGRFALQRDAGSATPTTVATVTSPTTTDAATNATSGATGNAPTDPRMGAAGGAGPSGLDAGAAAESSPDAAVAPRRLPAQRGTPVRLAAATVPEADPIEMATSPEQVASREHMQRAEALITVVAATPADAVMDSLTGRWAREMLTNTRLLLDSPAGDDIARRRLLEDLETLLVQLVQRSGGAVDERFLIDRTLERTQLLTRLRTSAAGI